MPCSVITSCSPGCRSKAPATSRWVKARCAHQVTSSSRMTLSSGASPTGRRRAAGVMVDRDVQLLADRPQRLVVVGVEERRQSRSGGRAGQQHAAGEAVVLRPAHLRDRGRDVVQHDLRDAGPPSRRLRAEVRQPPVVRLQPGPARAQVARVGGRRLLGQRRLREERRHGVGEDHLGDDAVRLELGEPPLGVPVAVAVRALHVVVRDLVRRRPRVEVVVQRDGR